ncbi:uncharacterized protein LY89DRAFT_714508 [Mollisia scopiformis]|uniref:CENP-V/GFA domain-containing protein n=1 Tax=Mollisia scopiformis TaxID=149040 RepID=A0A194XSS1_MOLSC|nr:uncharacterized protein LY89DRAFT_714508 [Mollisia scopiformis]KUJ22777.1 hypothetical protein LY89DRAFT_714508 [Mollisia scopiformis]
MATPNNARPLDPSIIFGGVEQTSEDERTTHAASCHCGAVQFNVTLKWPFPKYPVNKCSCSICVSTGYLLVYPCHRDVVFIQGYENMASYKFNTKTKAHMFCKTCGTSIGIDFLRAEQGELDPAKHTFGINVRTFKDLDLDALEYTVFDGKKLIPTVDNVLRDKKDQSED